MRNQRKTRVKKSLITWKRLPSSIRIEFYNKNFDCDGAGKRTSVKGTRNLHDMG
jgi:hypothetical protein